MSVTTVLNRVSASQEGSKSFNGESKSKNSIIFFVHTWFPNHQALINQIDSMTGFPIRYCTFSRRDRNRAWDGSDGVRVTPTVLPGFQLHYKQHQLNLNYGVTQYLADQRPALVVTKGWGDPAYLSVHRYARQQRIPIITWMCGRDRCASRRNLLRRFSTVIAKRVLRESRFVFVYGRRAKIDALELGAQEKDIVIVRHCVDESHFERADSFSIDKEAIKRQLGLGGGPAFLCVSQLVPRKGIRDLLSAFELVRQQRRDAQLIVIGAGELASEVRTFGLKHRGHFAWLPSVPYVDMPAHYSIADCLVLATHLDAWATVINEAHCSKLPIISSDAADAVEDLVLHGHTGLVYKAGNVHELTERMVYALDHPKKMSEMASNGNDLVKTTWNLRESARIWAEYMEIALREPHC